MEKAKCGLSNVVYALPEKVIKRVWSVPVRFLTCSATEGTKGFQLPIAKMELFPK
jgi:hypothetical protein